MTTIVIFAALIVVFFVAVVSPHLGGKVQRKTNEEAGWLKRFSNWLWDPLTWWAKNSLEFSRKVIVFTAKIGKKLRRKLPF
ncbi:MAG TPA: hypothetical protein VFZ62_00150 [Candidatus Saccharimonadales bacterium]